MRGERRERAARAQRHRERALAVVGTNCASAAATGRSWLQHHDVHA